MTDNTTPRPWHYEPSRRGDSTEHKIVAGIRGRVIASMNDKTIAGQDRPVEDAALIVRACNSYDELVAALDTLLSATGAPVQDTDKPARSYLESARRQAHAALAKAKA